jgi:hypothetical protein
VTTSDDVLIVVRSPMVPVKRSSIASPWLADISTVSKA